MGPRSFWEFWSMVSRLGNTLGIGVLLFLAFCTFVIAPILLLLGVHVPFGP